MCVSELFVFFFVFFVFMCFFRNVLLALRNQRVL